MIVVEVVKVESDVVGVSKRTRVREGARGRARQHKQVRGGVGSEGWCVRLAAYGRRIRGFHILACVPCCHHHVPPSITPHTGEADTRSLPPTARLASHQ